MGQIWKVSGDMAVSKNVKKDNIMFNMVNITPNTPTPMITRTVRHPHTLHSYN
jgi:hypothetical protein